MSPTRRWQKDLNQAAERSTRDLLEARLEKSVRQTCQHKHAFATDAKTGWPSDTTLETWYCPDCDLLWREELTIAEQNDLRHEVEG